MCCILSVYPTLLAIVSDKWRRFRFRAGRRPTCYQLDSFCCSRIRGKVSTPPVWQRFVPPFQALDRASGLSRYGLHRGLYSCVAFRLRHLRQKQQSRRGAEPRTRVSQRERCSWATKVGIFPTCYGCGSYHSRFVPDIRRLSFNPKGGAQRRPHNKGRFSIPPLSLACSVAGVLRFDSGSKTGATL